MSRSQHNRAGAGKRDALLPAVWWLLTALMVLCLVLAVFSLLAYPLMLANKTYVIGEFARMGIGSAALQWIGVLGVLVAAVVALTYLFLRHLRRIIDSVAEGQPFEPINADRLRRMAWLSLAIQVVSIPMTRLIIWFDAMPNEPNVHHNSDGISIGGIVLVLTLFVLARVFRTGAEMQEDLEGTV